MIRHGRVFGVSPRTVVSVSPTGDFSAVSHRGHLAGAGTCCVVSSAGDFSAVSHRGHLAGAGTCCTVSSAGDVSAVSHRGHLAGAGWRAATGIWLARGGEPPRAFGWRGYAGGIPFPRDCHVATLLAMTMVLKVYAWCHFDRSEDDCPNAAEKSPTGKDFYSCSYRPSSLPGDCHASLAMTMRYGCTLGFYSVNPYKLPHTHIKFVIPRE